MLVPAEPATEETPLRAPPAVKALPSVGIPARVSLLARLLLQLHREPALHLVQIEAKGNEEAPGG